MVLCKSSIRFRLDLIEHFRVAPSLFFEAKLSAKPLIFLKKYISWNQNSLFVLSLVLKVEVYGIRRKWPIYVGSLFATVRASSELGYSWEFLVGVCRPVLQILTLSGL